MRTFWSYEKINEYLQYAESDEAHAVLFVKKYLPEVKGYWVDVLSTDAPSPYCRWHLEYKTVTCALFPRRIHPHYPDPDKFSCQEDYLACCRALTWETAHVDIAQQREKGVTPKCFKLEGEFLPPTRCFTEFTAIVKRQKKKRKEKWYLEEKVDFSVKSTSIPTPHPWASYHQSNRRRL